MFVVCISILYLAVSSFGFWMTIVNIVAENTDVDVVDNDCAQYS